MAMRSRSQGARVGWSQVTWVRSVRMWPGLMALARMPYWANSTAMARVRATTPLLVAP